MPCLSCTGKGWGKPRPSTSLSRSRSLGMRWRVSSYPWTGWCRASSWRTQLNWTPGWTQDVLQDKDLLAGDLAHFMRTEEGRDGLVNKGRDGLREVAIKTAMMLSRGCRWRAMLLGTGPCLGIPQSHKEGREELLTGGPNQVEEKDGFIDEFSVIT